MHPALPAGADVRTTVRTALPRRAGALRILVAVAVAALLVALGSMPAGAHGELLQASPRADSTAGGEFHQIALQFGGLDESAPQRVELLDPAGVPIPTEPVRDGQRIVLPIEPLTVPGVYTVSYTIVGDDGDVSSGVLAFRYDPAADEPEPLTVGQGSGARGIDTFAFVLLLIGAGIAGYLVHRVMMAVREHRAARAARLDTAADPEADGDQGPGPGPGDADDDGDQGRGDSAGDGDTGDRDDQRAASAVVNGPG